MSTMPPETHVSLVVDDNPDVRFPAAVVLEKAVLDVVEVDNAKTARHRFGEHGPRVAAMTFVEVSPPGMWTEYRLPEQPVPSARQPQIVLTPVLPVSGCMRGRTGALSCQSLARTALMVT
ncbi:MAG TPA: hypothetical protein VEZ24_12005 [Microvirga sp.]|nr:hypothetical protein [Microvirga sp.]